MHSPLRRRDVQRQQHILELPQPHHINLGSRVVHRLCQHVHARQGREKQALGAVLQPVQLHHPGGRVEERDGALGLGREHEAVQQLHGRLHVHACSSRLILEVLDGNYIDTVDEAKGHLLKFFVDLIVKGSRVGHLLQPLGHVLPETIRLLVTKSVKGLGKIEFVRP
jgi:hypothetical protein